jgi:hypothetical protein
MTIVSAATGLLVLEDPEPAALASITQFGVRLVTSCWRKIVPSYKCHCRCPCDVLWMVADDPNSYYFVLLSLALVLPLTSAINLQSL